MFRWSLLLLVVLLILPANRLLHAQRHVRWLEETQQAPVEIPGEQLRFPSLVQMNIDQVIESRRDWELYRDTIRDRWLKELGPVAIRPRPLPKLEVLETEQLPEGITRQRVRYEALPGEFVEAYIVRPSRLRGQVPGIVVLHSTVNHSIRQPAGVEGAPEKAFGLGAARRGMVAFCPRNYLWPNNDMIQAQQQADHFLEAYPDSRGMARMLYDSQLAVDLLLAQPHVDAGRIGSVGHSLGAKEVIYLAAFDERVRATVSSEGGISKTFSNWDAPWYLGKQMHDSPHDHNELLGLVAPRAFLLIGGDSADGTVSWPLVEDALKIYRLYGRRPPLGLYNHGQGHAVPAEAEARIYEWLEVELGKR
ncbi:MAG: dienelactone hydrolase family protein [Planctomycetota bacterium]|nr:dienelactone hydrolase family protein [Planctomycetota bacterium]